MDKPHKYGIAVAGVLRLADAGRFYIFMATGDAEACRRGRANFKVDSLPHSTQLSHALAKVCTIVSRSTVYGWLSDVMMSWADVVRAGPPRMRGGAPENEASASAAKNKKGKSDQISVKDLFKVVDRNDPEYQAQQSARQLSELRAVPSRRRGSALQRNGA
jgi:hypothetical protein